MSDKFQINKIKLDVSFKRESVKELIIQNQINMNYLRQNIRFQNGWVDLL